MCPCGNWTNRVFTDYKFADLDNNEKFSFCYFCADGSDCWDEKDVPPKSAFKLNGATQPTQ